MVFLVSILKIYYLLLSVLEVLKYIYVRWILSKQKLRSIFGLNNVLPWFFKFRAKIDCWMQCLTLYTFDVYLVAVCLHSPQISLIFVIMLQIYYVYIYIYIYLYIYIYIYIYNETNDGEKVNSFYLKFKIFILVIYKISEYPKSVFTLNAFQNFFSSVKFQ